MKVIFLQDVPNTGKIGETKEVAEGYGRNFLIPKKLAIVAKPGAAKMVERQRQIEERKHKAVEAELGELAQQLEGQEITLKARVGTKDRLYGSITNADIASQLQDITGVEIDKRKIELDEAIHQLGSYEVTVRLAKDIVPKIKVTVVAEETS